MKLTKQYAPKEIYNVVRDDVQAPPWASNSWWYAQAARLDERNCERQVDHGLTRVFDHTNSAGRVLGYHCAMCGWERTMLVYEGRGEPTPPLTTLPPRSKSYEHHARAGKMGAAARARRYASAAKRPVEDDELPTKVKSMGLKHEGNWRKRLRDARKKRLSLFSEDE